MKEHFMFCFLKGDVETENLIKKFKIYGATNDDFEFDKNNCLCFNYSLITNFGADKCQDKELINIIESLKQSFLNSISHETFINVSKHLNSQESNIFIENIINSLLKIKNTEDIEVILHSLLNCLISIKTPKRHSKIQTRSMKEPYIMPNTRAWFLFSENQSYKFSFDVFSECMRTTLSKHS